MTTINGATSFFSSTEVQLQSPAGDLPDSAVLLSETVTGTGRALYVRFTADLQHDMPNGNSNNDVQLITFTINVLDAGSNVVATQTTTALSQDHSSALRYFVLTNPDVSLVFQADSQDYTVQVLANASLTNFGGVGSDVLTADVSNSLLLVLEA